MKAVTPVCIAYADDEENPYEQRITKYYTSYTVAGENQIHDHFIGICDEAEVSPEDLMKFFGRGNRERAQDEAEMKNKLYKDIVITCTIKYRDGSTEKVEITMGNRIRELTNYTLEEKDGYVRCFSSMEEAKEELGEEGAKKVKITEAYRVDPTFTMR
ncbi:MAG: hypothetical protein IJ733_10590 [Lachnospiraceae bacterium]|nr:hypothetical protein [Lachnospiraceae bacterium]